MAMFRKNAGIPVACPMADKFTRLQKDAYTLKAFSRVMAPMTNAGAALSLPPGRKIRILKNGEASGSVLPVNLTVFCSIIGTDFMPDVSGKILLLEDVNEDPYKIDRMLTQLHLAGILSSCSALIFGNFRKCGTRHSMNLIYHRFAAYINGPVFAGFPFGHVLPMACMRFGEKITLHVDGKITLK